VKKGIVFVLLLPVGMLLLLTGFFADNHVLSGALVGAGTIVLGLFAVYAVPVLVRRSTEGKQNKIDWHDERNKLIREKAAWYTGMITLAAMSVSALALALSGQLAGAIVIAGLILQYSVCIIIFSAYFSRKL
jgi:hypothetical protein